LVVMAGFAVLVLVGLFAVAFATHIGCKVGSLLVRCSQAQISLRVPKEVKMVPLVPSPKPLKLKKSTTLRLSQTAISRLRRYAEAIGVNEDQLARDLLEAIAQDDLYEAVLDTAKDARSISSLDRPHQKAEDRD